MPCMDFDARPGLSLPVKSTKSKVDPRFKELEDRCYFLSQLLCEACIHLEDHSKEMMEDFASTDLLKWWEEHKIFDEMDSYVSNLNPAALDALKKLLKDK